MYHYVRDLNNSRYPTIKGLDTALFRQQIDYLRDHFTIIRMEDLLMALEGDKLPDNAVLLTFDDGYIDHYVTVFPLLNKLGLQGSFFPPSNVLEKNVLLDVNKIHFILASADAGDLYQELITNINFYRGKEFDIPDTELLIDEYAKTTRFDSSEIVFIKQMLQTILPERLREMISDKLFRRFVGIDEFVFARELYCDVDQLATMKEHGMYLGLHGHNHGWLGNMKKTEYEQDIEHALDYMDSIRLVDKSAWVMNYPYGSWSDGVTDFISSKGCLIGLTTRVNIANLRTDNKLTLPRLDTNDFPPKSENFKTFLTKGENYG